LYPSENDIHVTRDAWNVIKSFNFNLIDHVIVTKDKCQSLRNSNYVPGIWRKE
jgi:DNA repair protein RadC